MNVPHPTLWRGVGRTPTCGEAVSGPGHRGGKGHKPALPQRKISFRDRSETSIHTKTAWKLHASTPLVPPACIASAPSSTPFLYEWRSRCGLETRFFKNGVEAGEYAGVLRLLPHVVGDRISPGIKEQNMICCDFYWYTR